MNFSTFCPTYMALPGLPGFATLSDAQNLMKKSNNSLEITAQNMVSPEVCAKNASSGPHSSWNIPLRSSASTAGKDLPKM